MLKIKPYIIKKDRDEFTPWTCIRGCCAFCEIFDICQCIGPFSDDCPKLDTTVEELDEIYF